MKNEFWIDAKDLEENTLMRWYITREDNAWTLDCDAQSNAPVRMAPYEVMKGRHEIVAVFCTRHQYDTIRKVIKEMAGNIKPVAVKAASDAEPDISINAPQRQVLHLKDMGKTDEEVGELTHCTRDNIKKMLYRLRKHFGFNSTAKLISFLKAKYLL